MISLILLLLSTQYFSTTYILADNCEDVQEWGFICKSCETMATCILQSGQWTTIEIGACDRTKNLFCNRNTKNCSLTEACASNRESFKCFQNGIFPDPYDCQAYHVCQENGSPPQFTQTSMRCIDEKTAFSTATNDCTLPKSETICRSNFQCNAPGDMGAWPGNGNIYYVCIEKRDPNSDPVIYPALFRCSIGEIFDGTECSIQDSTTTTPRTSIQPPTLCSGEGLFAHPSNCTMYYYCNSKLERVQLQCPRNTHFDARSKSCAFGAC